MPFWDVSRPRIDEIVLRRDVGRAIPVFLFGGLLRYQNGTRRDLDGTKMALDPRPLKDRASSDTWLDFIPFYTALHQFLYALVIVYFLIN